MIPCVEFHKICNSLFLFFYLEVNAIFFIYFFSDRILSSYGELRGELHCIEFETGGKSLGLSLAGNRDLSVMSVFVVGIQPDTVLAQDGRIHVGDELLEVRIMIKTL